MDDFEDLGFKLPEKCTSYTVRLRHSVVDKVDTLLAGASRSVLIESLLKKWVESITARRRERERHNQVDLHNHEVGLHNHEVDLHNHEVGLHNHEVDSADSLNG